MMSMVRGFRFALGLLVVVVVVSCTRQPDPPPGSTHSPIPRPSPSAPPVTDYGSFLARLDAAGLDVRREGQGRTHFLSRFLEVPGKGLVVEGEPIGAYEFPTEQALGEMRSTISPQGDTVGPAIISWDPPRFYSVGGLLVVYFGDDEHTLDTLRGFLGPKFAGR
jgi:hypothetical protein